MNKKGGADRRFDRNYQIPVCLYEDAHFTSDAGLNEVIQFSRTGVVQPFSDALNNLALQTGEGKKVSHQDTKSDRSIQPVSALGAVSEEIVKDIMKEITSGSKAIAAIKKENQPDIEKPPKEPLAKLLRELDSLVGAREAKEKIRRLTALAAANQARRERGFQVAAQAYHLVFTGNPGTGKTTFARLISRIFHSLGYLKKGHLVEVDRGGLVGGYLGQTALKTKEVIDKAKGGVLFIDEVYSLVARDDPYGQEAIATLVKAMEDLRDEFIIIVAGYTGRMEQFLDANPGLRSRFREVVHFEDMTADQLYEVFEGMVSRYAIRSNSPCDARGAPRHSRLCLKRFVRCLGKWAPPPNCHPDLRDGRCRGPD